jgi:predicted nucleotidyltransferase
MAVSVAPDRAIRPSRVLARLHAEQRPAGELRAHSSVAASAAEPRRGTVARQQDRSPSSKAAVSLRVQPQLVLTLREALVRARGLQAAFVYGPAAQAQHRPESDIDLMVIGDECYADCFAGLLDAEKLLKRRIHVRCVGAEEWRRKRARGSTFVSKLSTQPRLFIYASADDLRL